MITHLFQKLFIVHPKRMTKTECSIFQTLSLVTIVKNKPYPSTYVLSNFVLGGFTKPMAQIISIINFISQTSCLI